MSSNSILLLSSEFPPIGGGAGNAAYQIGRNLVGLGCDVQVVTSRFERLPREEKIEEMKIHRVPAFRRYESMTRVPEVFAFMLSGGEKIGTIVKDSAPDSILAFLTIPAGVIAYYAKKRWRIPYMVSIRGIDVPGSQPRQYRIFQTLSRPVVKQIWKKAGCVIANSHGLKQIALNTFPELPIKVIPNGVDTEKFSEKRYQHESGKVIRILFVGRISYEKGLQYLLPAISRIDAHQYQLEIVGDGKFRSEVEKISLKLGLCEKVHIRGWVPQRELPNIYQAADLLVLPSTSEGMPNVILEAMSSGLPVVATRIPGSEELVRDGESGMLVEKEDVDGLADAIEKLVSQPRLRWEMGQKGREIARGYRWEQIAMQYLALNRSLHKERDANNKRRS